jgi:3-hydroxyisobutyrate dehydrogenase
LLKNGAQWVNSPGEMADCCDVIFSMVSLPADVEQIYFADDGLLGTSNSPKVVIDMTTSSPDLAIRIFDQAALSGIDTMPVSGGDVGARQATLSIMAGGDESVFKS